MHGAGLVGLFEVLEDRYWNGADLGKRKVLLRVGRKLLSQIKFKLAQLVVLVVAGPHV